jgi:hypothetical protein
MYNRRDEIGGGFSGWKHEEGENWWNVKSLTNAAEQKGWRWKRTNKEIETEGMDDDRETNWNAFRIKVVSSEEKIKFFVHYLTKKTDY